MLKGSDLLVRARENEGVDRVFGSQQRSGGDAVDRLEKRC